MKIATFNANSIRSRLPILLQWLEDHQPDVLGIQETKVQDVDFPREAFESAGYHVVFKGEKSYNGVALICKSEPQEVRFGFLSGRRVLDVMALLAVRDLNMSADQWIASLVVVEGLLFEVHHVEVTAAVVGVAVVTGLALVRVKASLLLDLCRTDFVAIQTK